MGVRPFSCEFGTKAVKELFFTENDEAVFAISPKWPGNKLLVKNVKPGKGAGITLLGPDVELNWKQVGKDVEISIPEYDPNWNIVRYAYSFKIEKK